jgi:AcrR family transcriptional regulator
MERMSNVTVGALAMSSDLPPSSREPGRRGKQGETRARLIQVTIDLVRQEGVGALTTSRITRAAGIAQPGFYAHFKNVDQIVRHAVSHVVEDTREKIKVVRRRAFERFRDPNADLRSATRSAYNETLDVFLADPTFAELLLRYRRDPSVLGGSMQIVMERVREDFTNDLWRNAEVAGFKEEQRPTVMFWADQILALYFAGAEALLDGRQTDREMLVDALTQSSMAIMRANLKSMGLPAAAATTVPADAKKPRDKRV